MASLSSLFREKYERIILIAGILILLASVGWIVAGLLAPEKEDVATLRGRRPVEAQDLSPLRQTLAIWTQDAMLTATNQVLVSEPRIACINPGCKKLIRKAAEVCPFCGTKQPIIGPDHDSDSDGIPDHYELANGLDRMVPDAEYDLDGDGFTNLEEYQAGTAANDPNVHPSMLVKLRTGAIRNRPLYFMLRGLSKAGNAYLFQVNLETMDDMVFLKVGDKHKDYTIKSYDPKKEVLTIAYGDSAIDLPNGTRVEVPRRVASIINIIRPQYVTNVTIGTVFDAYDVAYEVADIRADAVVVRYQESARGTESAGKKEAVIPLATAEELALRKSGGKLPVSPGEHLEGTPRGQPGRPQPGWGTPQPDPRWMRAPPTPAFTPSSDPSSSMEEEYRRLRMGK